MKTLFALSQVALILLGVVGCLRLAFGRGAFGRALGVWRDFRPTFRWAFLLWVSVFVVDLIQTGLDTLVLRHGMRADYTPLIYQIEGGHVAALQAALASPPLTALLSFAYFIGFPALLIGLAHVYDRLGDDQSLRRTVLVYVVNYVLCLPFYFFFPVAEPWSFSPSGAVPLCDTLHPWLIETIRPMSGLDNCFPSYHCSLTVSLVLLALETAPRRLSRWLVPLGALILISTVYLGFHWMLDVAAGMAAGAAVHVVVRRFVLGEESLPAFTQS